MQACSEGAHARITCAQLHSAFCRIDFSEELRLRSGIALAATISSEATSLHEAPTIPMATSRVRQSVAHEVDAATLPAGVENLVLVGGRRRREGRVDLEETNIRCREPRAGHRR